MLTLRIYAMTENISEKKKRKFAFSPKRTCIWNSYLLDPITNSEKKKSQAYKNQEEKNKSYWTPKGWTTDFPELQNE